MTTDTKPKTIPPEKAECFAESRKTIANLKHDNFASFPNRKVIEVFDLEFMIKNRIEELDKEIDKIVVLNKDKALDTSKFMYAKGARDELKRLAGVKVEE